MRLTANSDTLSGRHLGPELFFNGFYRVPILAFKVFEEFGVVRDGGLVGPARAPVAGSEDEPRLLRGPPLRGKHLNSANHTKYETMLDEDGKQVSSS